MSQPMSLEPYSSVEYPASDGEPMAETDMHRAEMAALIDALDWHFREQPDVYVSGNNFIYYEEGNPKACISPDSYVVRGVDKKRRRIFKLWEEGRAPCFVIEVSSRKTWLEDIGNKKALCARLGVDEYFLYDPEADVVQPPLQGFRLVGGEYRRIEPAADGAIPSASLALSFWLDDQLQLHARDTRTGEPLLRPDEARAAGERADDARMRAEKAQLQAEKAQLQAEKERDALAERLRALGHPQAEE